MKYITIYILIIRKIYIKEIGVEGKEKEIRKVKFSIFFAIDDNFHFA